MDLMLNLQVVRVVVILRIVGDMCYHNYILGIIWFILLVHGLCLILIVILTYYRVKQIMGNREYRL